jgi:hypothetical protein
MVACVFFLTLKLFKTSSYNKHIEMSQGINEKLEHNLRFSFDTAEKTLEIQKCGVSSDCKPCQMNNFYSKCHETICYCCNDERKCWCQK